MKDYTVVYKDDTTEQIEVADKSELIDHYFDGDEEQFKEKVKLLRWNELSMQCVMDVATGEVDTQITSADVNPYGWRKGERP